MVAQQWSGTLSPMWARILDAPWWVRWPFHAAVTALMLAVLAVLLYPRFFSTTGLLWGVLALVGFAAIIGAGVLFVQHPLHQRRVAPMRGLN